VLRIWKVRGGGHAYYLEVAGSPERPGPEPDARWIGRGSESWGLSGPVGGDQLGRALAGTDPRTGAELSASRSRVTVAGFDLTFCAPKSVSLLHALGEPDVSDAVGTGHRRAVEAAVEYLDQRAVAVRRRTEGVGRLPVPGLGAPAAAFVHRTSRGLDPHLHTHVVLANVARDRAGDWSALDGRGIYAHASAAGALYQAQLRHELTTNLGVQWSGLRGGRADIEGIGPEARAEFSRRSQAIRAHLVERGLVDEAAGTPEAAAAGAGSGRARAIAAAVTRPARVADLDPESLRPWWQGRARAVGLGPRRLETVLDRVPQRGRHGAGSQVASVEDVAAAVCSARGSDSPFSRRHAVRAWASVQPAGAPAAVIGRDVERLMAVSEPCDSIRASHDGPGVAEVRRALPERLRRQEIDLLLAKRGMQRTGALELGHAREPMDRGMGLG